MAAETNLSCVQECLNQLNNVPGTRPSHRCNISPQALEAFQCASAYASFCANCSTSVISSTHKYVASPRDMISHPHSCLFRCRGHGLIAFLSPYELDCLQTCHDLHREEIVKQRSCSLSPEAFANIDVSIVVAGAFGVDANNLSMCVSHA